VGALDVAGRGRDAERVRRAATKNRVGRVELSAAT